MTEENNIENINNITENPEITEIIENTENSSLDIEPNLINETQTSDEVQKITPAPIIKKTIQNRRTVRRNPRNTTSAKTPKNAMISALETTIINNNINNNIETGNSSKTTGPRRNVNSRTRNTRSIVNFRSNNSVKVVFLGGLNQIGKNITAFECDNDIIIVDCGMYFQYGEML